jgi:repressor LexA
MSDRDRETVRAIREHIEAHDVPPTVRELGARLGLSSSHSVWDRLNAAEKAGLIRRVGPRALIVIEEDQ